MIRKTLRATQAATYSILLPSTAHNNAPAATGTGFFVSDDGFFVTAAHVVTQNGSPTGPIRTDLNQAWLWQEFRFDQPEPRKVFGGVVLHKLIPELDFALLKVDFSASVGKAGFVGTTGFPFLTVSKRKLDEGEPVYSFGYPLPEFAVQQAEGATFAFNSLCPRTTSAIISSTLEVQRPVSAGGDPEHYVLDKALNSGNSGGPIVAAETGHVHAWCSRFQPVNVRQPHLSKAGQQITIKIPSLYGVVGSLHNAPILTLLEGLKIPLVA